jgi:hypothetical protein
MVFPRATKQIELTGYRGERQVQRRLLKRRSS